MQGQWQRESLAKEHLEQVKCCKDTDCTPRMMKQSFFFALKSGEWEEDKSIVKVEAMATEWAFERIREAFEKSGKRGGRKIEHRTKNHVEEYRLLSAHHCAQQEDKGGVTLSYLCPNCNSFLLEDYVWWVSAGKKHCTWWCAICGEKIWLDSAQQAAGGANRQQCQSGQGVQSACGTCVNI